LFPKEEKKRFNKLLILEIILTIDFVTILMIDKNEDRLNDMQHVSFHNNIIPKLNQISLMTILK
jgi:hypothetical protein